MGKGRRGLSDETRAIIKENFRRIKDFAKEMMEDKGAVPPLFFIMKKDDMDMIDLGAYFDDKDLVADIMKAIQMDPEVMGTIFCSEAWVAKIDKDSPEGKALARGEEPDILPSQRKDKEEVLFLLCETRNGDMSANAPIIRSGEHPTIGALTIIPDSQEKSVSGRFAGGFGVIDTD